MNTNVNLEAAIGVLAFLGTGFLLGLATLVILHAIKVRQLTRARRILFSASVVLVFYVGLLLVFSHVSREKALAFGEEKYFCEIDCHLAYSVMNVRKTQTLGNPPNQVNAKGVFYVVTIKTRFDENTISSRRGNEPLRPNPRVVSVLDEWGNSYGESPEGCQALALSNGTGTPLDTPLRPGESYTTELVFDLPVNIKHPSLLVREQLIPTRFIIGHENSFLHKKTMFQLEPPTGRVASLDGTDSPTQSHIALAQSRVVNLRACLKKQPQRKYELGIMNDELKESGSGFNSSFCILHSSFPLSTL